MFTGIVQQTGIVASLEGSSTKRLTVRTELAAKLAAGDSIAVNGTCLTVVALTNDTFAADLLEETLRRTTLGEFVAGRVVNLELPTPAGAPLGGHIVQGHVDGIGTVGAFVRESNAAETWRMSILLPESLRRYTAEKGSIAIDGISLTVAAMTEDGVEVAIIPHTYAETNISTLKAGDAVNVEVDPLAKYAERLIAERARSGSGKAITLESLISGGY